MLIVNIYIFCLSVGVIFTIVSFIISGLGNMLDAGFDLDVGIESNFSLLLPIKPFTVMTFITVFGGSGLILTRYIVDIFTVPMALFAGYIVSKMMYEVIYMTLVRAQKETKSNSDALGCEAVVLESIPSGGIGRISYIVDDNKLSAAARELIEGNGFKKGEGVVICKIEDNIFFVDNIRKYEKSKN